MAVEEIVGLAPSGSMGSGYNLEAFERGLAAKPHFIGQDAGTTDTGPYYHGTGLPFLPLATYRHDMSFMLRGARAHRTRNPSAAGIFVSIPVPQVPQNVRRTRSPAWGGSA